MALYAPLAALWSFGVLRLRAGEDRVPTPFAISIVAVQLALSLGALDVGRPHLADPCTSRPAFSGGGVDGEVQRFALSGLSGAACRLHTTREELVLSFVPAAGTTRVRWDRATIEDALRAGFDRAAHDTERRGVAGFLIGHLLELVIGAPLDFFLDVSR